MDLNLLRSVAEIAFRQAGLKTSENDDSHQRLGELQRNAERIQVARNCLSYTIAAIVDQCDSSPNADAVDFGVDIPSFVSTGQGRLNLLQDIERYLLRVGQTLRQYTFSDPHASAYLSDRSVEATDLRPFQRHMDKTTRELLELTMRICGKQGNPTARSTI